VLLAFNCSKSCCFEIGKSKGKPVSGMWLGHDTISWCNSFKYLGVSFRAGHSLRVKVEVITHTYFFAFNSVLDNSHSLHRLLQLELQEFCCFTTVALWFVCCYTNSQSTCRIKLLLEYGLQTYF
jgi:hypothetical protein